MSARSEVQSEVQKSVVRKSTSVGLTRTGVPPGTARIQVASPCRTVPFGRSGAKAGGKCWRSSLQSGSAKFPAKGLHPKQNSQNAPKMLPKSSQGGSKMAQKCTLLGNVPKVSKMTTFASQKRAKWAPKWIPELKK